jgi:hypothetical protein
MNLSATRVAQLHEALATARYSDCAGTTHGFYHYPARFSPDVARTVIELFSERNDVVLDPFMGGGTSIIEGLCLGRRMVGSDINALAHFVTMVRTAPLSVNDGHELRMWALDAADKFGGSDPEPVQRPRIHNLPGAVETFVAGALALSDELPYARQQAFARCALLRLGQKALDCRDFGAPRRRRLGEKLPKLVEQLLSGLDALADRCREIGITKSYIAPRRVLLHRNASTLHEDPKIAALDQRPRLVFTSPPYPSVHVLYHRWQYRGRKETAAPYWIARVPDGFYESYYTGGSRTPTGRERYFQMIEASFRSVRKVIDPEGLVVQLVGFSDAETQLPRYLAAMASAGFREVNLAKDARLDRRVPNRKWYAKLQGAVDAATELLLVHRPS